MIQADPIKKENEADSFKQNLKAFFYFLKTKSFPLIFFPVLLGIFSCIMVWKIPRSFSAKMIFLVEEGKSSNGSLGGLASIAGQFGFDLGSAGGNSGIFSGDNILSYFKSPSLAKEVLLTTYDSLHKSTIADGYVKAYSLEEKWEKNGLPKINFGNYVKGNRLYDSLLHVIANRIIDKNFNVVKADKKSSFIEVEVSFIEEKLAKVYCEQIVQIAVKKYLQAKTQRQETTVNNLQKRADSIAALLNLKTYVSANLQTTSSTLDINPLFKATTTYKTETTTRDKVMLGTIFGEVIKNLELAKFTLSQETPVIQVIDKPVLPLEAKKINPIFVSISVILFIAIIMILYYSVQWQLKKG